MKLEEIAPYLPYKVKILRPDNKTILELVGIFGDSIIFTEGTEHTYGSIDKCRLILNPLSDLIEPCLPDGKIPMVELAKVANVFCKDKPIKELYSDDYRASVDWMINRTKWRFHFRTNEINNVLQCDFGFFIVEKNDGYQYVLNQLQLFQKLFEWHFDVFGLIKKGEAINTNIIEPCQH